MRIGIDAGGTFTDFIVVHDNGAIETFKLRSNPRSPASVILAGLAQAAAGQRAEVIHGSTVATNALLERKGARTALVTTAGFEDVIHIGRQNRAELYNLTPKLRPPIIPRTHVFRRARAGLLRWHDRSIAVQRRNRALENSPAPRAEFNPSPSAFCTLIAIPKTRSASQRRWKAWAISAPRTMSAPNSASTSAPQPR